MGNEIPASSGKIKGVENFPNALDETSKCANIFSSLIFGLTLLPDRAKTGDCARKVLCNRLQRGMKKPCRRRKSLPSKAVCCRLKEVNYMSQNNKEVLLTEEGLEKLKQELEHLKTTKRHEVAQRLKEAIAQGDLSENSEYDAAKEEQAFIESRIITLENMIRNAKIIGSNLDKNVVSVGSKVTIQELPDGDRETYTIVGSAESNPSEFKISNESPIGKELIGRRVDDVVHVATPSGTIQFKIIEID